MRQALDMAFKAAPSEATVLLRGESGTGKGVLARAIHARSPRAAAPFVTVHCPSLSAELLESELFGHVPGRFTGAVQDTRGQGRRRRGRHAVPRRNRRSAAGAAAETAAAPAGEAVRAGRRNAGRGPVDVRILAATNRDLQAASAAGRFREDLLYRLNVIEVVLPPLRQRRARHPAPGRPSAAVSSPARAASRSRASPRRHRPPWPAIPGRATSASCATPSSGASSWPPNRSSGLADLPAQVGSPPPSKAVEVGGAVTLDQLEAEHIRRDPGRHGHPGRGGDRARHRPEHPVPQAQTLRAVNRIALALIALG